ncbi:class 3-domain-containing protein [Blakeslea trispora]|nr:class 3-domain-containing protein [Blakeslea trispora]
MAKGRNRLYFAIAFVISSIPSIFAFYALQHDLTLLSSLLFALSIISLGLSTFLFLGYKTVKHGTPMVLAILASISRCLTPLSRLLARTIVIGPVLALIIRTFFFLGFIVLLMSDQLIRACFRFFIGKHPSGRDYSITSAMDPHLGLFDPTIPEFSYLENSELFKQRKELRMTEQDGPESRALTALLKRPKYSVSLAYTLSVASKLVYEDVDVIKHELKKSGFNVDTAFRPIAYKNICAFITEKDDDILLVFRGTNPLNIQNYITNLTFNMTEIKASWGPMGRVHKGFWKAMGEPPVRRKTSTTSEDTVDHQSHDTPGTAPKNSAVLRIELTNTSVYRTVMSAIQGTAKIISFLSTNLFHHVKEPIDSTWVGPDIDIRSNSMFIQAEQHILSLMMMDQNTQEKRRSGLSHSRMTSWQNKKKKRLFITGHSLGGAMGTIFLAKMLQSKSPLLDHFAGLYTFGQPKIGDAEFAKVFSPSMTSKIFHHVYNNDIIPRVPVLGDYDTPPGSLVYIDSAYNMTIYPPNPYTNEPVPVRAISFLHLSGLLNRFVIRRLPLENRIRILFRILFPFFLNDHFPCDYSKSLQKGRVQSVIMGAGGLEGGHEDDQFKKRPSLQRRYSIVDVSTL